MNQARNAAFLRFAVVGVISTLVDFSIFTALSFFGVAVIAANIAAYLISLAINFGLNHSWTFAKTAGDARIASLVFRFLIVHAVSLTLSTVIVSLLAQSMAAPAAKAISIPIIVLWTYLGLRLWAFSPRRRPPTQRP